MKTIKKAFSITQTVFKAILDKKNEFEVENQEFEKEIQRSEFKSKPFLLNHAED